MTVSDMNETMTEMNYPQVRASLLQWFEAKQRKLPWREHYRPYEIWISEIMLQQTQVKTMLPYYARWLERFPRVPAIARAREEELLKYWEGLGYYTRVRNIYRVAHLLVEKFDAEFPKDHALLLKLPGIGRYTAGAIMSIAFNADYPVVDGNVARILARLLDLKAPVGDREIQKLLWQTAAGLLPRGEARNFNQALMDLGALVCTPRHPSCCECPIQSVCQGLQGGVVSQTAGDGKKRELPFRCRLPWGSFFTPTEYSFKSARPRDSCPIYGSFPEVSCTLGKLLKPPWCVNFRRNWE